MKYHFLLICAFLILTTGCEENDNDIDINIEDTSDIVTDIDGNEYSTVTIDTQVWMVENLKTTKYNDGTEIPLISGSVTWYNIETPGYCWYNNDELEYKNTYGALYNWYAVNTEKLCPLGWHVPTDLEWTYLSDYLGNLASDVLKESGTTHWNEPNSLATNETGFTALPGGIRKLKLDFINSAYTSEYINVRNTGEWWSLTEVYPFLAYGRNLNYYDSFIDRRSYDKKHGLSVRCLKD